MATKAQKTKVGLFVVISAAIIIGGLLIIGGYRQGENLRYYIIFDKTVLGLYRGGLVQYLGVPVGTVDNIYVGDDGKAYVEILIDPSKVTLRRGVEATLEYYSFATGTMCVALYGGEPGNDELPPGSTIPTGPSIFESFSGQASDLMETLTKIAEKINTSMEGMEEGELTSIVDEIKPFIDETRQFIQDARDTLKTVETDLHSTIEEARPGIKKFTELAENAAELSKTANDTLKDVRAKIEPLDLEKLQSEMLSISTQLKETAKRLEETAGTVPYTVDNVQHALVETLGKLNEAAESFQELADVLKQNSYIRGTAPRE